MASSLPVIQFVARPGIIDLGWGHPRPALLPIDSWASALATTLRGPDAWPAMAYGHSSGPGPLIEWLAEHLAHTEGCRTDRSQFFVTAGASHALALATQVITTPGDIVLVDAPTYHLAFRTIVDGGGRIVPVPVDHDGPDIDGIGRLIARERRRGRRVAMLYLVPTFGNPTGRSLPHQRGTELIDLARRLDFTVVEDDTYRELTYDGTAAPPSLWSRSGGRGVVRIGSFAKTVAPGIRLGWINAATDIVARLAGLGYVESGGGVNHTNAYAMATFGMSGAYQDHVRDIRRSYAAQRDALVRTLRAGRPDLEVPRPAGGWFVWVRLPRGTSASRLLGAAERRGVSVMEGTKFYVDGRGGDGHIRLSYSLFAEDELVEAANRLVGAIGAAA